MPPVLPSHPDPARLRAFRVGAVSPEELTEVEAHLAGCPTCCASLQGLPDDALVELVQRSFGGVPPRGTGLTYDLRPPDEYGLPPELAEHARYKVVGLLGAG